MDSRQDGAVGARQARRLFVCGELDRRPVVDRPVELAFRVQPNADDDDGEDNPANGGGLCDWN